MQDVMTLQPTPIEMPSNRLGTRTKAASTHTCPACIVYKKKINNNHRTFIFALVAAERSTTMHVVQSLHAHEIKRKG
jgi:hypothetical protein